MERKCCEIDPTRLREGENVSANMVGTAYTISPVVPLVKHCKSSFDRWLICIIYVILLENEMKFSEIHIFLLTV